MRRVKIPVTTDASGNATVYSPRLSGKIHSIQYVKTDFAAGVDFAITSEAAGENIWTQNDVNASASVYPRAPTHSQAGVASLYATGGTAVQAPIAIGNDRIKFAISQGGNAKSGAFHVLIDN